MASRLRNRGTEAGRSTRLGAVVDEGWCATCATAEVLARMVAVRIHLDDCDEQNGPLRVLPGSHRCGLLSDNQIIGWPKADAVTCTVRRGDVILMRPLLLHASSAATAPVSRRVIHIEHAANDLPDGLGWREQVA